MMGRLKSRRYSVTSVNSYPGQIDLCKFCKLNLEQKYFVEVFIKNRQHHEIEKELGISYPTVRNKLDKVISDLGHTVKKSSVNQKEIIESLEMEKLLKKRL